jgi:adenosine deaminase CECR1
LYFHAGESTDRNNENLYDAILLGTKRIGHGIRIASTPYLVDIIKEKDIGFEICPISNFILGYTLDLRWHPIKMLMNRGVAVTINSDDPTFWDYQDLSLDFTYAYIAWQLDLKDLKQLGINSIKQSSIKDELKPKMLKKFDYNWNKFIKSTLEKLENTSQ